MQSLSQKKSERLPPAFVVKAVQSIQSGIINFANQMSPAFVQILQISAGMMGTQVLYAAAKLNLADRLKDGPKSSDELANETGSNADALYRLLRALASIGVFRESPGKIFEMTSLGEALRSDHPVSVYPFALLVGDPLWRKSWGDIMHSIKTGENSFNHVFGKNYFDYLDGHKDDADLFNKWMTSISNMNCPVIAASYPFSKFKKIIDIGGGHGSLMAHILKKHPACTGVVFDLPKVIESATEIDDNIALRCEMVGGSFFDFVPGGGNVYIMQQIIHDWEDEAAIKILAKCREAMDSDARLLVVDAVINPGNKRDMNKFIDLQMLFISKGGRERTAKEFKRLFEMAGLQMLKIIPTASMFSIIEGRRS